MTRNIINPLAQLRHHTRECILDLALGIFKTGVGAAFDNKLLQVVQAHQREISRKIEDGDGSPEYFERVRVYRLMAMRLMGQLIERLDKKKSTKRQVWTANERRTVTVLSGALNHFDFALDELGTRFPWPELTGLPEKFFFNFCNLTREECEDDAAAVLAQTDEANNSSESIEDIHARL